VGSPRPLPEGAPGRGSEARPGGDPYWPLLLTMEDAAAFLRLSEDTFRRICPVAPVDLGARLLRWRRPDLETWVEGMPARLKAAADEAQDAAPPPVADPAEERRLASIERARARVGEKWKTQSRSSSASPARAAR
jgi:predicted DNA-binding transcriptional regulator AlpA